MGEPTDHSKGDTGKDPMSNIGEVAEEYLKGKTTESVIEEKIPEDLRETFDDIAEVQGITVGALEESGIRIRPNPALSPKENLITIDSELVVMKKQRRIDMLQAKLAGTLGPDYRFERKGEEDSLYRLREKVKISENMAKAVVYADPALCAMTIAEIDLSKMLTDDERVGFRRFMNYMTQDMDIEVPEQLAKDKYREMASLLMKRNDMAEQTRQDEIRIISLLVEIRDEFNLTQEDWQNFVVNLLDLVEGLNLMEQMYGMVNPAAQGFQDLLTEHLEAPLRQSLTQAGLGPETLDRILEFIRHREKGTG